MTDNLLLTHDTDNVRLLTFHRPDKLNAFDTALYRAVANGLSDAADDDTVHVVVLTGAGRAFSAGQDLDEMAALRSGASSTSGFPDLLDALQAFPKPLLAAVNGVAVGIGMTMLCHCDMVLIDENARLRTPFTEMGVPPEAASSLLFPARMGWQRASRLLFTSDWVTAPDAVGLGLALEVVPTGTVVEQTMTLARRIAQHPLGGLRAAKEAMLDTQLPAVQRARSVEDATFARVFGRPAPTDDTAAAGGHSP